MKVPDAPIEDQKALFLDFGTRKLHIAARGSEEASWPTTACGVSRRYGRPKQFWARLGWTPSETCHRCLSARLNEADPRS
jgi:hypothetical protein